MERTNIDSLHVSGHEFSTRERDMNSWGSKKLQLEHLMILICLWVSLTCYWLPCCRLQHHQKPSKNLMEQSNKNWLKNEPFSCFLSCYLKQLFLINNRRRHCRLTSYLSLAEEFEVGVSWWSSREACLFIASEQIFGSFFDNLLAQGNSSFLVWLLWQRAKP